jgi:cytochrome c peroxidase
VKGKLLRVLRILNYSSEYLITLYNSTKNAIFVLIYLTKESVLKVFFLIFIMSIGSVTTHAQKRNFQLKMKRVKRTFKAIPKSLIDEVKNADLIALGKKLYFEKKLSVNNSISCNSCHQVDNFGVDNEPTSPGHEGKRGGRNSPTTFNAAFHISQFWDGRAKDLAAQAIGPILNPVEMGMPNEAAVISKLSKIKSYVTDFKKAFPGKEKSLTYPNIGMAIAAYEKTLITPSRFDDFLNGDENALTFQEKRGLKKFMGKGCATCHRGVALGGDHYFKIGLVNEYKTKDMGRFEVTKRDGDQKVFKVPSLRNIMKTGPYFHDGSVKTIDAAIELMAHHQLGQKVGPGFIEDVKAFFTSLTTNKKFNK